MIDHIKVNLKPYLQAFPDIFNYQIAAKAVLGIWLFLFDRIFQALLISSGRVAVTSGDFLFLFTTWQGLLIIILGIVSLFLYVAFDLNAMIILSRELVNGRQCPLKMCFKEALTSIKAFLNIRGILVVLYISFIAPILGIGISISLTESLHIPTFIAVFIKDSILYSALAGFAALLFLSVGIANLYVLHGIIIDKVPIKEAGKQSSTLIRENWKDYLKQNILYILIIGGSTAGIAAICLFLPLKLISILSLPAFISRPLTVFFVLAGVIVSLLADLLALPVYIMKMTQLFYTYKQGEEFQMKDLAEQRVIPYRKNTLIAAVIAAVVVLIVSLQFDWLFPSETSSLVIAHRGGGAEAGENTLAGLEHAARVGAYGSEIDIQRTRDGYYIINHDGNFKRVAGDRRKPEEMTLKQVRKLSIDGEPVPTFEEMLSASKGKLVLFIELKGKTADRKMADDAVRIVKEYQMEEECVLISLKYDVIDYIETKYPEMQTGFLTFASFGRTAALNCDYLGLEEDSATVDTILAIHNEHKKVLVWTVNDEESQRHFLCSQADGLITDQVSQAVKLDAALKDRSDLDRMIDKIKTLL